MIEIGQRGYRRGVFFTISSAIGIINSIVAGAGVALLVYQPTTSLGIAIASGVAVGVVLILLHGIYQMHRYGRQRDIIKAHR
jgi:hypothetical protein